MLLKINIFSIYFFSSFYNDHHSSLIEFSFSNHIFNTRFIFQLKSKIHKITMEMSRSIRMLFDVRWILNIKSDISRDQSIVFLNKIILLFSVFLCFEKYFDMFHKCTNICSRKTFVPFELVVFRKHSLSECGI